MLIRSIHIYFGKLLKRDTVLCIAKSRNLLIRSRRLTTELITGKIENFQPLRIVLLVNILQIIILWRKSSCLILLYCFLFNCAQSLCIIKYNLLRILSIGCAQFILKFYCYI